MTVDRKKFLTRIASHESLSEVQFIAPELTYISIHKRGLNLRKLKGKKQQKSENKRQRKLNKILARAGHLEGLASVASTYSTRSCSGASNFG